MTDIVGSTDHAAELGDRAWHELLEVHHALIRAALRRSGGRELDTAGDGFFVAFDAPATAVAFALEAAQGVAELGIDIRAGIHVGEVEQMARKVTGITVVIASRIMTAAGAGEVLVSSTVRDLTAGSGLMFEDRGVRELKGVPGEWHIYEVGQTSVEDIDPEHVTARQRRASAVRRAQDRPIWERRPRLTAAMALGLALVLATGGLLLAKPWQPAALSRVAENSIAIIDPDRAEVVGEIKVGTRPGGIAAGEGFLWVTNTGDDTVSQIDPLTGSVSRIPVGRAPRGVAVTDGSVWIANSGERSVQRISVATGRVVDTLEVGNGPTAIAAYGGGLWVANSTDSTVVRIDVRTSVIGVATGVAATPIALAVDAGGLWVASEDGASISHLDPATGVTLAAPIQLAARPSALALDAESVWVASADGTVTRIDRASNRVTTTVVGRRLAAIAIAADAIWVGDLDGTVYRIDPVAPSATPKRLSTSSAIAALAVVDGDIWLAAQVSAAKHRGGTLRIVQASAGVGSRFDTDPLGNIDANVAPLEADGLVGYRHVGGTAGSTLLPDLATSIPRPSNGGLTYAFQLREGLTYATGAPVRASDFRRGLERSFQVEGFFGIWGQNLKWSILGADACAPVEFKPGGFKPIERCDLSSGIVTDDSAGTVIFDLKEPDPDFVVKLTHPSAFPVPEGIPMNELLDGGAFPGTGPYVVTGSTVNEVRLGRNPHFTSWDDAVRPDGYPNEIVFTVVADDAKRIEMVENGEADYTPYRGPTRTSHDLFARIKTQYAGRWHVASTSTHFVSMNATAAPFDDERVRKALNFAIDRAHMAGLAGGPPDAAVTCQLLPANFPGYQPYCPYTLRPDAGGRWKQADLEEARRLVDASGTRGTRVVVGPTFPAVLRQLEYLGTVLEDLGYQVAVDKRSALDLPSNGWDERTQVTISAWGPDYVAASNFLGLFKCGGDVVIRHCDPEFEAKFDHATELQATDPAAAAIEWAALDRLGVDRALLAPMYNAGGDFVSARVGNYQFNPAYGVLFDQLWVE